MDEIYTIWKDPKIVGRALDLSLASYIECSLQPSEYWPKRQTFQNPGEFNFLIDKYSIPIKDLE